LKKGLVSKGDPTSSSSGAGIPPAEETVHDIPIMKVTDLSRVYSEDLVKRALGLLSLWGECVYFESPPKLSDIVILDPRFLAKGILADLFSSNPTVQSMKKNGVMRHADLQHIWKRFKRERMSGEEFSSLCSTFITLLQTLGVFRDGRGQIQAIYGAEEHHPRHPAREGHSPRHPLLPILDCVAQRPSSLQTSAD